MKPINVMHAAALACFLTGTGLALAQATPAGAPTTAPSTAPSTSPATAPGARAGRGGGRGRGAPLTEEDQAIIAKGATYPEWKPGSGVGNFSQGPQLRQRPRTHPERRRTQRKD